MKNIEFTVSINATPEKVWDALWKEENYPQWTTAFSEGSHLDSYDLKEGNIVKFLAADGNNGMYALIEVLRPAMQMTFKYLGEIKDGKEVAFEMNNIKDISGSESYILLPQEMGTDLNVEIVVPDEWVEFFGEAFPSALQTIKSIAES